MVVYKSDDSKLREMDIRLRHGYVPACLLKNGKGWHACEFADSQYVLMDVTQSPGSDLEVVRSVFGVSMVGMLLQGVEQSYFYAKVNQYVLTKNKAMLAILTRHFSGLYESVFWDQPLQTDALFRDRMPDSVLAKPMSLEEIEELGYPKITSGHHIHYTYSEVMKSVEPNLRYRISNLSRLPSNASATMATTVLLWGVTASEDSYNGVCSSGLFKARTTKEFTSIAKSISVEAKSLQNIVSMDLREVFELDVLLNRVDGEVDWEQEKENRERPKLAKLDAEYVRKQARIIFSQAVQCGKKPVKMLWKDYWASRWQWSASGSVHSQYIEDDKFVIKTDRNLKNKFIMISNMPKLPHSYFLSRSPEVHAWSSTKYEWGKLRAIYGTDTTSYILSNFAMYNCENVLPNRFPVGKAANDRNVVSRVRAVLKDRLPYCLDFEDFNSQHSPEAMREVVLAYGDVFRQSLTEEQLAALVWTAQSIQNQVIHDNSGTKTTYTTRGTLLSGWRLTTFVNSVLNAIYSDAVLRGIKRQGSSLHNGDDVIIGATSLEVARLSIHEGRKLGIRIQPSKCAFGAIAEFLRVDHTRGSKGQYLSRACATLVHSRIESKPSTDARDLTESMENRFADCLARGMSIRMISNLRLRYYARQSLVCKTPISSFYIIKNTHRVAGGISEAHDAMIDNLIKPGPAGKLEVEVPQLMGVNDYALEVAKSLEMLGDIETLVARVRTATLAAVTPKSRRMNIVPNPNIEASKHLKAIYKAFRGKVDVAGYGKAALVGFALDVLQSRDMSSTLTQTLARSKDPERLLKFLV
ncbi:putative RNA dependent RNA polymerase [Plasmopara viticola lesion associated toti 1]|uniref:RNA-directed RNA polymerase n=1 Tax=Plasmopara viticola lesion associated toti 1 TaxID=2689132 RepID=A0A6B9HD33_9VIRU|nr:putative RNA dependent RNA polymerase [Plasmopara viticola lesion associated toti 1]